MLENYTQMSVIEGLAVSKAPVAAAWTMGTSD